MFRVKTGALCAAVTVLTACVNSHGLRPQDRPLDPAKLHAERSFADLKLSPASWPATDWWRQLGDPQLTGLIEEALRDNPGLAEADAVARQAQAQAQAAFSDRWPDIGFSASAMRGKFSQKIGLPAELTSNYGWTDSVGFSFSWDLDIWGGKRAAWEAAVSRSRAAEIDRQAARIELSVNVARAYIQLGEDYALRDIAEQNVARSKRVVELTRMNIQGGLANPDSRHQVQVEYASAQQAVQKIDAQLDSARIGLAVLLGKGPDRGLELPRPKLLAPLAEAVPPDLPINLLGRRPDLVAARWRVEAVGRDIKSVKAQFLPNISLSASARLLTLGNHINLFQFPARMLSAGPALSLPIFDAGRLRASLRGTDAQYDQAVSEYNQTLVKSVNQVADLLSQLRSVDRQLQAQGYILDNAQHSWDNSLIKYHGELGTELDTLIVRRQLLDAQQNQAQLVAQQQDLSMQLIDALGGGFHAAAADLKMAPLALRDGGTKLKQPQRR